MTRTQTDQPAVLIVDPDTPHRRELAATLEADRLTPIIAPSLHDAGPLLREHQPAAALISLLFANAGGLMLLDAIRDRRPGRPWDPDMPILTVSDEGDRHDAIRSIERGAHDHLTLPLHYPEVSVRLRAMIRRAQGMGPSAPLEVGPLQVDISAHRATMLGQLLRLSAKEFSLLATMAKAPRRVFSKAELLRRMSRSPWNFAVAVR